VEIMLLPGRKGEGIEGQERKVMQCRVRGGLGGGEMVRSTSANLARWLVDQTDWSL
jgi:hypothetical protein